jgi:hypothetical protein
MERSGRPECPIWLVGDSNPTAQANRLDWVFDARHPTRHSIWTPIWDAIQDQMFRRVGARLDRAGLYILNAVEHASNKPSESALAWPTLAEKQATFAVDSSKYNPLLILSFGQFSFEFCRRALERESKCSKEYPFNYWTLDRLAAKFHASVGKSTSQLVPLLHATIARGNYLQAHEAFVPGGNYFDEVGRLLADRILIHHRDDVVWVRNHE